MIYVFLTIPPLCAMLRSRVFKSIVAVFLVFSGLLFAGAWYFSSLILYPPVECKKEHHVYCSTPGELGLSYEDVAIPTSDGLTMRSWYIPAAGSTRAIIVVHGHGGMKNEGLRFAKALNGAGYNLLLLDLRRNSGGSATMGYLESKDVINAVDFLEKERKQTKIGIFGFSMGAATSILAMSRENRILAGLFSSGYTSVMDELRDAASRDYHLPYFPLLPLVRFLTDHRAGIKLEEVRPIDVIASISPRPLQIFHCDRDDYVDSSHGRRLFEKAGEPRDLWLASCARHERVWNEHPEESEKRAVDFFQKYL